MSTLLSGTFIFPVSRNIFDPLSSRSLSDKEEYEKAIY